MNEQQLAAVKHSIEILKSCNPENEPLYEQVCAYELAVSKTITALQSIISQDALDKMAEDAVTIGLRLDDWDKIGCVNHDCDKCKAVQEPVAWVDLLKKAEEVVRSKPLWKKYIDGTPLANDIAVWMANFAQEHTTPPAAQPAPVQEPVGLTDDEIWKFWWDKPEVQEGEDDSMEAQFVSACRKAIKAAAPQPVPVQDAEGENKAVRFFLMLYGQPGLTVGQMKGHMRMSGFKMWPAWVDTEPDGAHLTKAGAQLWIRHLFATEVTPPVAHKAWVGLTDYEMQVIEDNCLEGGSFWDVYRTIEAKLKEKNGFAEEKNT
jgi:hypothetical protein